jgi:hypothetical protein
MALCEYRRTITELERENAELRGGIHKAHNAFAQNLPELACYFLQEALAPAPAPAPIENLPESIAEMKRFIHDITHGLQLWRSKTPQGMDDLFQKAYRLYSKYNVEEPDYPPVKQPAPKVHGIDCLFDEFKDCKTCEANPYEPAPKVTDELIDEIRKKVHAFAREAWNDGFTAGNEVEINNTDTFAQIDDLLSNIPTQPAPTRGTS